MFICRGALDRDRMQPEAYNVGTVNYNGRVLMPNVCSLLTPNSSNKLTNRNRVLIRVN